MKRQRCCKKEQAEPFTLATSPGILAGFYFSCGPVAGLGFFIGYVQGFEIAIVGNALCWFMLALLQTRHDLKRIKSLIS